MPRPPDPETRPIGDVEGESPDRSPPDSSDPARELHTVILVGWQPAAAGRLMDLVQGVAPGATIQRTQGSRLRFAPSLPAGTLLILPDRLEGKSGVDFLRQLRSSSIDAPAIILGEDEPAAPDDLEALGAVDLQPLAAFSRFSFRRALKSFDDVAVQQRLLEEMSSRFHAYERVLESKDDERLRVLQVAGALERRLAETERKLERLESVAEEWQRPASPEPAASGDPEAPGELEDLGDLGALGDDLGILGDLEDLDEDGEPFAPTQVRPPDDWVPPAWRDAEPESPAAGSPAAGAPAAPPSSAAGPPADERIGRLESELTAARDHLARQEAKLAELRQHGIARERELRRLVSLSATAGDLATRLEASERIRRAQTREMLNQQQVIAELEERIESLAELLDARRQSETADPGEVLAELESRLAQFEKIREQQQRTINQLSRTLAVQQVDDALDDAQSRRNVLQRVEEAVRRSQRSGTSLTCMMIGIDHPGAIRDEHGSVLYDYMLVQVAQRLQVALRHRDILLRYGDEAFVLLTDAESGARARPHAERLMRSVCDGFLDLGLRRVKPSISIAILHHRPEMSGAGELIRVTMKRLVAVQRQGEQQIVVGPEPVEVNEFEEETLELEGFLNQGEDAGEEPEEDEEIEILAVQGDEVPPELEVEEESPEELLSGNDEPAVQER